ncbi:MAG: polysaccharide pyruvyl transferase family protein [Anaerolineaceae bacterium]|nr:MAG: polysaccharide pyruvyl transferase family protein [Anaerolineaceae bacterium]
MGKKILFLGTHGQYNIGDELLLETFLSQLGEQNSYMVNSYDPAFTNGQLADQYDVEVFHTTKDKWELPQRILRADYLFFGGGSVLKELYASVGRNRYATLFMILFIVFFARVVARKPVIMSNIGVGPIHTSFGFLLAKVIMGMVNFVSVRDQNSYDTCQKLGIDQKKLLLVPDAVFVNAAENLICKQPVEAASDSTLRIALNLNYNIANPSNWEAFLANLADALKQIGERYNLEIHALPMQTQFNPQNDLQTLRSFQARIPDLKVVLHEPSSAQDVAQILSQCDLVMAERLHALVLASILKKPFVALIYDVKVEQLAKYMQMEGLAVDINRPFEMADLTGNIIKAINNRQDIIQNLANQVSKAAGQLQNYFIYVDEQLLASS